MNSNNPIPTPINCIVSKCMNKHCPKSTKLFFEVPSDVDLRNKWMAAINKNFQENPQYICEDHFNLEEDVFGSVLKEGSIPHKFECQEDQNPGKMKQQQVEIQINGKKHILKGTILPASSMVSKLNLSKIGIRKPAEGLKIASKGREKAEEIEDNIPDEKTNSQTENSELNITTVEERDTRINSRLNIATVEERDTRINSRLNIATVEERDTRIEEKDNRIEERVTRIEERDTRIEESSEDDSSVSTKYVPNMPMNFQIKFSDTNVPILESKNFKILRTAGSGNILDKNYSQFIKTPPETNPKNINTKSLSNISHLNRNLQTLDEVNDIDSPIEMVNQDIESTNSSSKSRIINQINCTKMLNQEKLAIKPSVQHLPSQVLSKNIALSLSESQQKLKKALENKFFEMERLNAGQLDETDDDPIDYYPIEEIELSPKRPIGNEATKQLDNQTIPKELPISPLEEMWRRKDEPMKIDLKQLPTTMGKESQRLMKTQLKQNEESKSLMETQLKQNEELGSNVVKIIIRNNSGPKGFPIVMNKKSKIIDNELFGLSKLKKIDLKSKNSIKNKLTSQETSTTMEKELPGLGKVPKIMENGDLPMKESTGTIKMDKELDISMEKGLLGAKDVPKISKNLSESPIMDKESRMETVLSTKEVIMEGKAPIMDRLPCPMENTLADQNSTVQFYIIKMDAVLDPNVIAKPLQPQANESLEMVDRQPEKANLKREHSFEFSRMAERDKIARNYRNESFLKRLRLNEETNTEDCGSNVDKIDTPSSSKHKIVDFVEDENGVKSKVVKYGNKKYVIKIGVLNKETPVDNELEKIGNERNAKKSTAHVLSQVEISKIIRKYNDKSDIRKMKEINAQKDENNGTKKTKKITESADDLKSNIVTHQNKNYVIKMGVLNKDSSLKNKKISKVIQPSNMLKNILLKNKDDPKIEVLNDSKHKIVNIRHFLGQIKTIALHNIADKACALSNTNFISKIPDGLSTQLYLKCKGCQKVFKIFLADKHSHSKLNISAVSASVRTGIGYGGLKALCEGIGVKPLFKGTFDCYNDMISKIKDNNQDNLDPLKFEHVTIKQEIVDDIDETSQESNQRSRIYRNLKNNTDTTFCENSSCGSSSSFVNERHESLVDKLADEVLVKEENIVSVKDEIDLNNYHDNYS